MNETGAWAETEIPTLPKAKIDPNHDTQWDVADLPDSIPTSKLATFVEGDIPNLSATKITTGIFASADRIPTLPSSKIDPATTFAKSMINTAEEWPLADIPNLPATKITTGTFAKSMITTGDGSQWAAADIPDLSVITFVAGTGNKIQGDSTYKTDVTYCDFRSSTNDFPSTSDIIGYKAVSANYNHAGNSIGTTYELIDSNTLMGFTVPASRLVEIELSFYAIVNNEQTIYARLVNGGTSNEFASNVIDDDALTPSTEGTAVYATMATDICEQRFVAHWALHFPSAQVGQSKSIDVQLKIYTSTYSASTTVKFGRTSANVGYSPVILKATGLPSIADLHVHTSGGF